MLAYYSFLSHTHFPKHFFFFFFNDPATTEISPLSLHDALPILVRRVGSETTDAVVNVRFVAATNGAPETALRTGDLREALYYRLRVVPIYVPPLRERPEDIPLLAEYFLSTYWARHRSKGQAPPRLTEAAIRGLCAHPWRGNVRELQNVIEH